MIVGMFVLADGMSGITEASRHAPARKVQHSAIGRLRNL